MTAETIRRPWRELNPVYTKQPVVKTVEQTVEQAVVQPVGGLTTAVEQPAASV